MTLEELKAEAKELGYRLVPEKTPMPRLLPCSCGRKRIERWVNCEQDGPNTLFYACPDCDKTSAPKPTEREAREAWNEIAGKDVVGDV